jgi:hypothetical protein
VVSVTGDRDGLTSVGAFVPGDEPVLLALSGDEEIDHTLTARHLVDARFGGRRLGRTRDHLADDAFPIDRRFIVAHGDLPK